MGAASPKPGRSGRQWPVVTPKAGCRGATTERRQLPVACNRDCGGGCPLLATVEGGRVVRIADNPAGGEFLKGCIRGYQAWRQQQAPERLTAPLVRSGPRGSGRFRAASWAEALARVAEGLTAVRERHGDGAVLALGGSGSCRGALHNTAELLPRFLNLIGGGVEESSTYSSAASAYVERVVLGTRKAGVDPATLRHSGMIVLWGANLVDCIMGCEWRARVREAKRRGVPVVVIDPRRTETAKKLGTEWLPVRPGTDSALMLAILHVWITDRTLDEAFVAAHATGFESLRRRVLGEGGGSGRGGEAAALPGRGGEAAALAGRGLTGGAAPALEPGQAATPEWAEGVCGVPAARIVALAREWARRRPVALIPGLSIQRTMGGEEAVRLAIALQVASGDLGRLGGSAGSQNWNGLPQPRLTGIEAGPNPSGLRLPANDWADAVLRGRAGGHPVDIRAAYNVGGNYVTQGADVAKSIRAMEALEFSVCHELFLTATARYCDVVLPATHWLEREDIVFTTANYLLFSHKVAEPPGQARDDYEVFAELAGRMGCGEAFTEGRDAGAWLRSFVAASEIRDESEFLRTGIYMAADQERVGLADFAADPEAHPLATPSGRVELAGPACVAAGLSEVPEARVLTPARTTAATPRVASSPAEAPPTASPAAAAPRAEAPPTASPAAAPPRAESPAPSGPLPLHLITPKSRLRVHSQLADIPWFRARDDRSLWLNPRDAAARGIADGSAVLVRSARGRVRCACRVTDDLMPGVVSLCEGIEPEFDAEGCDVAGAANVLTADEPTLPSRGATMHSTLVEVEAWGRAT